MARKATPRTHIPATGIGARLTEVRRSNAAGRHQGGPARQRTRSARRRAAIADART